MKRGDILEGSKRRRDAAFHFIVFLDGRDDDSFVGAVLTHSSRHNNNVSMIEEHFKKTGADGEKFEFQFDNTHLVRGRFIKLQDWGPFRKIGELSEDGLNFVESQVGNEVPVLWDEYIKSI